MGWVAHDFGLRLSSLVAVPHGADRQAQVWRGTCDDGSSFAVKLSTGGSAAGLLVTQHLAGTGVPGVPEPLTATDGRPWSERPGGRLSVMTWIAGDRAADVDPTLAQWTDLGRVLAAVHAAPVPAELAAVLRSEDLWHGELVDDARPLAEQWPAAAQALATVIDGVVQQADRLSRRTFRLVLCHADPHRGNLLVRGDQVWLIDWDDAVLAPRECDLMFGRVGLPFFGPADTEQRTAFDAGYGITDAALDPELLAFYACRRALEDITDWTRQALDVRLPARDREQALAIVRDLLSPSGLVGLAAERAVQVSAG
ncbi:aminoglycoside O-phosphotransferase APH(9)-Ia [Angustibacter luteus]